MPTQERALYGGTFSCNHVCWTCRVCVGIIYLSTYLHMYTNYSYQISFYKTAPYQRPYIIFDVYVHMCRYNLVCFFFSS